MVEGHGVHRVAHRHRKILLGKVFQANSPNGRFALGAKLINMKTLARIEAIGKNLFYFWSDQQPSKQSPSGKDATTVVHVHFGMSGQFKTATRGTLEATKNTRLELVNEKDGLVAHLSAMTVNHGGLDLYEKKRRSLGQDPLRDDADKNLVWEAFKTSRKSVGMLLMDQSVIAGLGNIYRAEVLFKAGVHPETPGASIDYESFTTIWEISKELLLRGFETGSILTVDPEEGLPEPWTRRYIYNHSSCGRCGTRISTWDMGGRTCYACPTCQVLGKGSNLSADRKSKLRQAKPHQPFVSRCAPEAPASALDAALEKLAAGEKRNVEHIALVEESTLELGKMAKLTVRELREMAKSRGFRTSGKKEDLVKRLASSCDTKPTGKISFRKRKRRQ
ncbi:endonuclease 8 [Chloropicon primus]|uniref:DNA-(apurinic or apyrimidinic site) lyase n=2 Tax=Chloropicon primus TaxID=1764295 RepID=A0A5B8MVE3_9CHLO|nr:hypothetical protein A3770_10p59800 [Chloropicon primus]UPR02674.1 endonuclease 8 [Chloropicon primus]|eukprot:QDZ23462.1 hypothetical protein A3770_10p59800 [Chloropicon primus]